jgi:hypothetical protein
MEAILQDQFHQVALAVTRLGYLALAIPLICGNIRTRGNRAPVLWHGIFCRVWTKRQNLPGRHFDSSDVAASGSRFTLSCRGEGRGEVAQNRT